MPCACGHPHWIELCAIMYEPIFTNHLAVRCGPRHGARRDHVALPYTRPTTRRKLIAGSVVFLIWFPETYASTSVPGIPTPNTPTPPKSSREVLHHRCRCQQSRAFRKCSLAFHGPLAWV